MNSTKTLLLSAGVAAGILGLFRLNPQLSLSSVYWARVWRRALAEQAKS